MDPVYPDTAHTTDRMQVRVTTDIKCIRGLNEKGLLGFHYACILLHILLLITIPQVYHLNTELQVMCKSFFKRVASGDNLIV